MHKGMNDKMREVLRSIGVDPDDPNLQTLLQFTKSGRLRNLLGSNLKVEMGNEQGVLTAIMHLAPEKESGYNTCSFAGNCASVCIKYTGQLVTGPALRARISKTIFYRLFQGAFLEQLRMELRCHTYLAKTKGMVPAVRLNGTSDIIWEKHGFMEDFPELQFYDYTKVPLDRRNPPPNYHLTYSLSEAKGSMEMALRYLRSGRNAALVVQTKGGTTRKEAKACSEALVEKNEFMGFPVTSGNEDDIRFRDPTGHWVALYAKGPATKDTSGFVQRLSA